MLRPHYLVREFLVLIGYEVAYTPQPLDIVMDKRTRYSGMNWWPIFVSYYADRIENKKYYGGYIDRWTDTGGYTPEVYSVSRSSNEGAWDWRKETTQEEMLMRNILVVCISLPVSELRTRWYVVGNIFVAICFCFFCAINVQREPILGTPCLPLSPSACVAPKLLTWCQWN
jgi:hypothetical protein